MYSEVRTDKHFFTTAKEVNPLYLILYPMPVTKTAKRALRGSLRKQKVNRDLSSRLEIMLRMAKKQKKEKDIVNAISLADRLAKKKIIHKNKAARIKSSLSKFLPGKKVKKSTKTKSN